MPKHQVDTVLVEVVEDVEGLSLYLDNRRIAGPKPRGSGRCIKSWRIKIAKLQELLEPR